MAANIYIIAGPNGAGKTTFAREFLPNYANCKTFINADLIAQGISPLAPEEGAFRAGRLMLEEIQFHADRDEDFGFETTLSGLTHATIIRCLKKSGYKVHIFYLFVPSVDLALTRIQARVREGGHDVPELLVRRRFDRSIRNFFGVYRQLADAWTLIENSYAPPAVIATQKGGKRHIIMQQLYGSITNRYAKQE